MRARSAVTSPALIASATATATCRHAVRLCICGLLAVVLMIFLAAGGALAAAGRSGGGRPSGSPAAGAPKGGSAAGPRHYGPSSGHRPYYGHGPYYGHSAHYRSHAHFGFYFGGPLFWPWYPAPYYAPYYPPYYGWYDPAPPGYVLSPEPQQNYGWYYCPPLNAYYPYVTECPVAWQRVEPYPPPLSGGPGQFAPTPDD
jgi:hypothetical protein